MGGLTIGLCAPGMSLLHRAGLAGLWLTLDGLDRELEGLTPRPEAIAVKKLGSWARDRRSVTLRWESDGEGFFRALLRYAYPVTANGLLYFAAFGDPMQFAAESYAIHTAMLATFLQHPKSREAERGKATGCILVQVEDAVQVFPILRVQSHSFATAPYSPTAEGKIAGWLFPGGAERHVGLGAATRLSEPPGPMLALRFAPVGCLFFLVRRQSAGGPTRQQVSLVVPDVDDLEEYAALRWAAQRTVDLREVYTAGPAEAVLRLLALEAAHAAAAHVTRSCRVITFGTVPWSSQQRTRVAVLEVERVSPPAVAMFDKIRHYLPARRVVKTPEGAAGVSAGTGDEAPASWVDVPQVPELAAENLIRGRPWWLGFAQFITDQSTRKHVLSWERKGLAEMIDDPHLMPPGPEQAFVRACHVAWHRRLGQISQRAQQERLDFKSLVEREYEKTRITFSRCKTAAEFRRAITDFWARGGRQDELKNHWPTMLPFLTGRQWAVGRDLALLALASYAGGGTETPQDRDS